MAQMSDLLWYDFTYHFDRFDLCWVKVIFCRTY